MPVFNSSHGIDTVLVLFDKEDPVYKAGCELTGHVVVKVEETSPVRGIKIKVSGRMDLYWRKVEGGNTIEFAEIEDYLDENINVWLPNARKKEEQWVFPGIHRYPFSYHLPHDLPESLEDSRYGSIRYSVKATVFLTMGRTSTSLEEAFSVIGLPDPRVEIPIEAELPKENVTYATIGGSCFTGKTDVELYMTIEQNIFRRGDIIPVHVECTILGSSPVSKVIVLLVQESIYCCNLGSKEEERKKEILVVAEAVDEEDADSGECQKYDLELEIDEKLPLSTYPFCDFIKMGYFVHAVARTHSFYDDIVVKLPIYILSEDGGGKKTKKPKVKAQQENQEEPTDPDIVEIENETGNDEEKEKTDEETKENGEEGETKDEEAKGGEDEQTETQNDSEKVDDLLLDIEAE